MVRNINYSELEIDHLIDFTQDSTTFIAAKENDNGHFRVFLVDYTTGRVYIRNGLSNCWEELFDSERNIIISRLINARNRGIPVFRINAAQNLS